MIKKPGQPYKGQHVTRKAPKGPGFKRPKSGKSGKPGNPRPSKPKPDQYPKGHPLSPTLEQDRLDTLNNFYNSIPNRLDAFDNKKNPFEEADPVLPDIPKAKPKFGLFESPW